MLVYLLCCGGLYRPIACPHSHREMFEIFHEYFRPNAFMKFNNTMCDSLRQKSVLPAARPVTVLSKHIIVHCYQTAYAKRYNKTGAE